MSFTGQLPFLPQSLRALSALCHRKFKFGENVSMVTRPHRDQMQPAGKQEPTASQHLDRCL